MVENGEPNRKYFHQVETPSSYPDICELKSHQTQTKISKQPRQ
jgi:hypothetical protein